MSRTLRDLRRYSFPELIENDSFKSHISGLLSDKQYTGSILICGEDGYGRNYAAKLIARDYLEDTDLVQRGIHPDFLPICGNGISGQISIDSVREVTYECNKASVVADNKRVVFIRDAFNLNAASANALLKALEQPPEGVLFIMTARKESDLIPTVLSRCVVTHISPVSTSGAYEFLATKFMDIEPDRLHHICEALQGHVGIILKTLSDQHIYHLFNESEIALNSASKGIKLDFGVHMSATENRSDYKQMIFFMCCIASSPLFDSSSCPDFLEKLAEAYTDLDQNININLLSSLLTAEIQEI